MNRLLIILTPLSLAFPAFARDPIFNIPLDCTLGQNCYIQKYVDHDPSPNVQDYQCGTLASDGHKGTDFALLDLRAMARGVNVLAAAPGRVRAVRDNMPDISVRDPNAPNITGKECGNGIVIEHGAGWGTQYCHMKLGSITVKRGDKVAKGMAMGQVGLSGETEYPHVHLSVRYKGKVVDPFASKEPFTCNSSSLNSLWQTDIPYKGGGILNVGISAKVPEFSSLKHGMTSQTVFDTQSPALIAWTYSYGAENGDIINISLVGPKGEIATKTLTIDKTIALFFRATGLKKPEKGWPKGMYIANIEMLRDGKTLSTRSTEIEIK